MVSFRNALFFTFWSFITMYFLSLCVISKFLKKVRFSHPKKVFYKAPALILWKNLQWFVPSIFYFFVFLHLVKKKKTENKIGKNLKPIHWLFGLSLCNLTLCLIPSLYFHWRLKSLTTEGNKNYALIGLSSASNPKKNLIFHVLHQAVKIM